MSRSANVAELLKRGDGRHSVGDSLYLVVRGGSALWEYRYRHERRLRSQWLGSAVGLAPMTLTQARAARAASWLERRGTAPTRTARAQLRKQQQQSNLRFAEAAANFFDRQSDTWCKTEGERVRGLLKNYAAPLNDKPINRITVDDVAAVLKPIWTGPGHSQGSRLRGILERIFKAAKVDNNPAAWDKLKDDHLSADAIEADHHPSLPYTQLPSLMAEIAAEPGLSARALQFIILTGVRETEALGADWSEFDLEAREWTIPAERMKMRRAHVVPLSAAAIACLGPRRTGHVFPSSRRNGHIGRNGVWRLLRSFGRIDPLLRKPITTHGFRATLSTWAEDNRFPPKVIDLVLAHKERNRTKAAYQRSERIPERRELLETWARFVTSDHATATAENVFPAFGLNIFTANAQARS